MTMSDDEFEEVEDFEEGEAEDTSCRSLFDVEAKLESPSALIDHDKEKFGFDLRYVAFVIGTDDITLIKLVNFVRGRVMQSRKTAGWKADEKYGMYLQQEICSNNGAVLQDDKYMIPIDNEDPMLYLLAELLQGDAEWDKQDDLGALTGAISEENKIEKLQQELSRCKAMIAELTEGKQSGEGDKDDMNGSGKVDDAYYFDGYGHLSIHETMLRDRPRTSTYQAALIQNSHLLKGKVVLDIGCGTGILCMFAAKAGAKKVIGVDSSNIIDKAEHIVRNNGFSDTISLVKGRLEEIPSLPGGLEQVDVIVSEWMGYALYFENMLTSVLYARDKWLNKQTGLILPSRALVYVEALSAEGEDDRVEYWSDVYGFDMKLLHTEIIGEAQVQYMAEKYVASNRFELHDLDISVAADRDLNFVRSFSLHTRKACTVNGFIVSFDVLFDGKQMNGEMNGQFNSFTLSTGCAADSTHWKQTVLWLKPEDVMSCEVGENIGGNMHYQRSEENPRDYLIVVTWVYRGSEKVQAFDLKA